MPRRRTTVYAAFAGTGVPVINVWGFDRKGLEGRVADRISNGDAFDGEHVVHCYISFYLARLAEHGYPQPAELLAIDARRKY